MKALLPSALILATCVFALSANAQTPPRPTSPQPTSTQPAGGAGSLPPGPVGTSAPMAPGEPSTALPGAPAPIGPGISAPMPLDTNAAAPAPSPTSAGRAHLHRPGTDVDGDLLTGSLASDVYVLKGNVTLHSDPKIDREIGAASESDEPLTVTADEVDVDKVGMSYVAKGNVHFKQGTRSGQADLAMLDEQAHTLDLVGNANVFEGDRRAAAAKMHYNMLDKHFLGAGDVRIYEPLPTPNPNASGTPAPKRKRRLPL